MKMPSGKPAHEVILKLYSGACQGFDLDRIGFLFLFVVYFFWNKEAILPKHAGAHKAEKRRKELSRRKKQEERRQRRFHKGDGTSSGAEKVEQEETKPTDP
jgi:hypothetical protein